MPIFCTAGIARPEPLLQQHARPDRQREPDVLPPALELSPITTDDIVDYKHGGYSYPEIIPGTWMTKANVWNDYEIDRVGQKTYPYSGIKTFPLQDIAMMENQWGPLAKREHEHLVAMDYHMIYLRRKLLKAAKALRDGIEPEEPWIPVLPLPQRLGGDSERRFRGGDRESKSESPNEPDPFGLHRERSRRACCQAGANRRLLTRVGACYCPHD